MTFVIPVNYRYVPTTDVVVIRVFLPLKSLLMTDPFRPVFSIDWFSGVMTVFWPTDTIDILMTHSVFDDHLLQIYWPCCCWCCVILRWLMLFQWWWWLHSIIDWFSIDLQYWLVLLLFDIHCWWLFIDIIVIIVIDQLTIVTSMMTIQYSVFIVIVIIDIYSSIIVIVIQCIWHSDPIVVDLTDCYCCRSLSNPIQYYSFISALLLLMTIVIVDIPI